MQFEQAIPAGPQQPASHLPARSRAAWESMLRVIGNAGNIIAGFTAIYVFTVMLGTYWTALPLIGYGAPFTFTTYGPLLLLASVTSAAWIASGSWRRHAAGRVLVAMGLAAALLAGSALAQLYAVARANAVTLSFVEALDPHPTMHSLPSAHRVSIADGDGGELPIAIYAPADAQDAPVLVYVHGGGFVGGSHLQRGDDLRWFAERGFLVFSLEYSASTRRKHHWDTALAEIGCSLAWIRRHAAEHGGNGSRVVLLGDSAGGNLVLNAGFRLADRSMPQRCESEWPQVAAIGALYPVVNVAALHDTKHPGTYEAARDMAEAYIGGSPSAFPERYRETDPVSYLSAAIPPTLVLHGTHDTTVTITSSHRLLAKAEREGAPVRLVELPFAEHSFDKRATLGNQFMRQAMAAHFAAALGS